MTKLNMGFDERGLLGVVAHPKFKDNGKIYVYYSAPLRDTAPSDWNHTTRISEFTTKAGDQESIDLDSEKVLLEFDQPVIGRYWIRDASNDSLKSKGVANLS